MEESEKVEVLRKRIKDLDLLNATEQQTAERVLSAVRDFTPREASRLLRKAQGQVNLEREEALSGLARTLKEKDRLDDLIAAGDEAIAWMERRELAMQKPIGSAYYKLRAAHFANEVCGSPEALDGVGRFFETMPQIVLVEHNWGAAFSKADDEYRSGETRLPYDACCFEFVLSGMRVLCVSIQRDAIEATIFLMCKRGWVAGEAFILFASHTASEHGEHLLQDLIERQIKAIVVALEIQVATTDVIRANHRANASRERQGKAPFLDYHVVTLTRRDRPAPLQAGGDEDPTRRVRMHFRRGHWRHYDNHKTWIKWMLVGDPDLGFIDKHYRL
jgi:hypothetical protein